jgi:carboxyvinyl-carboxyphosphonate phosphorylmutase
MSTGGQRLKEILQGQQCVPAASIFDPLSARIAEMSGWRVGKLSGSAFKAAELCLPDGAPLASNSDLVDVCRRVCRVVDMSIMIDADDGGETPLAVRRLVRELEAVGVGAVEIEDNLVPRHIGAAADRHAQLLPVGQQVVKLDAALNARRDTSTLIIARTSALTCEPLDDALARLQAYSAAGVDALMLPGVAPKPRALIEAVHGATGMPLCVVGLTQDMMQDREFLAKNLVRIRYFGQPVFGMAVQALYYGFSHLLNGGDPEDLEGLRASPQILSLITRSDELAAWELSYRNRDALNGPETPDEGRTG